MSNPDSALADKIESAEFIELVIYNAQRNSHRSDHLDESEIARIVAALRSTTTQPSRTVPPRCPKCLRTYIEYRNTTATCPDPFHRHMVPAHPRETAE